MNGLDGVDGRPFFHRPETHALIDELGRLDQLTIYVGAGASIERTGLDWAALCAELLGPALGSFAQRRRMAGLLGAEPASSAVVQSMMRESPDGWRRRLTESLRTVLHKGETSTSGVFDQRVATLVQALHARGRSVVVVTPNYDDFVEQTLHEAGVPHEVVVFGVADEAEALGAEERLRQRRTGLPQLVAEPGRVLVVHLHGLVTKTGDAERKDDAGIHPVFSESDYARTAEVSAKVLRTTFDHRNVLVVGSSMSDAPLVRALSQSRRAGRASDTRRWAVLPIQGMPHDPSEVVSVSDIVDLHRERLNHLGVALIAPEYFVQAPQLLEEIKVSLTASEAYSTTPSRIRYGARLSAWWDGWYAPGTPLVERQAKDHSQLLESADLVRDHLGAAISEALRIEIWLRWQPTAFRELRLWASSTGTWVQPDIALREEISGSSRFVAVKAFTSGGQVFGAAATNGDRWRTYLARPVWWLDEQLRAYVPVGAITVASMWDERRSVLNAGNWIGRRETTFLLDQVADRIVAHPGRQAGTASR